MVLLKFFIHNEAIKNDPPEIYGWRVYALALSVGLKLTLGMLTHTDYRRLVSEACCMEWSVMIHPLHVHYSAAHRTLVVSEVFSHFPLSKRTVQLCISWNFVVLMCTQEVWTR